MSRCEEVLHLAVSRCLRARLGEVPEQAHVGAAWASWNLSSSDSVAL